MLQTCRIAEKDEIALHHKMTVINTETTAAMSLHAKQTDFLETTSHLKIWILPMKENLNS
jgi:hypothetical protein